MILVAAAMAVFLVAYAFLQKGSDPEKTEQTSRQFDTAIAEESSTVLRTLLKVSKPLAGGKLTTLEEESPTYRALRLKLAAAGGKVFGGSAEVFLSTQIAATLVGACSLLIAVVTRPSGAVMFALVGLGLAVIAWPYSKVWEAEKKRSAQINQALPEFAELLLMPLNSGYGILPALDFTAARLNSPVSDEVKHLLDAIRSRSMSESEAFEAAGDHLGTSAAKSFFAVLAQAYLEGVRVVDTVSGQAVQLRKTEFERLREQISKMENTIAVMTGIHLLPGLFIVILFPALVTMGSV